MKKKKLIFDVVGALIKKRGKILICQRNVFDHFGSQWEFPGGKVEKGEGKIAALKREIKEELGIQAEVGKLIGIFEDEIPTMKIVVYLYSCSITRGTARCIECQDLKWATLKQIAELNLAPADRKICSYLNKCL
jgi:mutator protein MutT